jgi:hypothetical protein
MHNTSVYIYIYDRNPRETSLELGFLTLVVLESHVCHLPS